MTSLMPETIEPATGTLPLPKAKKARVSWTHAQVAGLFKRHYAGEPLTAGEHAKLVELGLIAKPDKPTLGPGFIEDLDDFIRGTLPHDEPLRSLAVRASIKALTALLPKRVAK